MKTLVLGGTGPTGPLIVDGLLARGHDVTVLHGGQHEVALDTRVEHLHADVHFAETLAAAIEGRTFDLVLAMYGRLRETAGVLSGRTDRLIAIGTTAALAGPHDPRWGPMGRPVLVPDADRIPPDPAGPGLLARVQAAADDLFAHHARGDFRATLLGYSILYGPRQVAPEEWCVLRRLLDGRRRLVIADGGLKLQQRLFVDHAAAAVLLAVDHPAETAGRFLAVGERPLYTIRQRIEAICRAMELEPGRDVELVDLPYELARPAHYLWGRSAAHNLADDQPIRDLGFREAVPADEAIARTVRWLGDNRQAHGAEWDAQVDDTFDYPGEDALLAAWDRARAEVAAVPLAARRPAHRYRLPRAPGEPWTRPDRS